MTLPTQARQCQNCYHMWHVCKERSSECCADFENRQQGILRQLRVAEDAMSMTVFYALVLVFLTVSPLVWASL